HMRYYEENVDHREQTDKLIQATMDSLDKTATDKTNLLKALNGVTETLKVIQNVVKDDPTLNKKNVGHRMTVVESSQTEIRNEVSSLRQDTSDIKYMMTEFYQAFKVVTKEPPSHTKGETEDLEKQDMDEDKIKKEKVSEEPKHVVPISSVKPTETPKVQPITTIISTSQPRPYVPQREGKGIAIDEHLESPPKLVKASYAVHPNPDAPILVPYMINGKLLYLTEEQILAYMDKEDQIKKAEEEAKRLAMTKTEVHKRQHTEKVKRLTEFNKKRAKQYMWTMSNRLKPEPIIDVKIYPNSKPAVLTVYRNNDKKNFDVHNPFKFADFGITELDELGLIIQKKKNTIVKDMMTSLGKRHERLKKIPEDLGIQSALPAPVPKKDQS
ncbi:hypothetical protein Tco_0685574, partial [Tanacetum coccineum]